MKCNESHLTWGEKNCSFYSKDIGYHRQKLLCITYEKYILKENIFYYYKKITKIFKCI